MMRIGFWLAIIFFCLAGATHAAGKCKYDLIILEPLAGHTACESFAINNKSEIVGYSGIGTDILWGPSSPVYWGPDRDKKDKYAAPQNIGTFGDDCGVAFGINDGSYVVGRSGYIYKGFRAFLWDPTTTALRPLAAAPPPLTQAWDLNIHGVVSGQLGAKACLFELGKPPVPLGPDTTFFGSYAFSVNNAGLAAGDHERRAVIWNNGVMQELAPAYPASSAWKVNNTGEVIGMLNQYTDNAQAFIWDKFKGLRTYEVLKNAFFRGINNKALAQVVGYYIHPVSGIRRAFIWEEGQALVDLNSRLVKADGWYLTDAYGINDKGEIVGKATKGDNVRGFLLLPRTAIPGISLLLLN